ncbi:MAG: tyrosine-type recombinase/integrase [Dehalococcoidia bacterium]
MPTKKNLPAAPKPDTNPDPHALALSRADESAVVTHKLPGTDVAVTMPVPRAVLRAGRTATLAFLEFFAGIENPHTREAYLRNCLLFFAWARERGLEEIDLVTPLLAKAYAQTALPTFRLPENRTKPRSKPTVKQHLAALTELYNFLVSEQIVETNPFGAVKRPKYRVQRGKTPYLGEKDAIAFLESIDTSTLSGIRDRAYIGTCIRSFGRVSAVLNLNGEDYYPRGNRWYFHLREKNGWELEVPAHHKQEEYMHEYLAIAGHTPGVPLFRSLTPKRELHPTRRLTRNEALAMVKRRARKAEKPEWSRLCNHTWRATGITNFLEHGGTVERAAQIAGHRDVKTTKLYDRRDEAVSLDDIERIQI